MYIVIKLQTNKDGVVGNLSAAAVSTLPVHAAAILDNHGVQIAAQAF